MLDLASWDEGELTGRYDHVFHMKMCPRDAYTSANNAARRETYEEALALDGATWAAWDDTQCVRAPLHTSLGYVAAAWDHDLWIVACLFPFACLPCLLT